VQRFQLKGEGRLGYTITTHLDLDVPPDVAFDTLGAERTGLGARSPSGYRRAQPPGCRESEVRDVFGLFRKKAVVGVELLPARDLVALPVESWFQLRAGVSWDTAPKPTDVLQWMGTPEHPDLPAARRRKIGGPLPIALRFELPTGHYFAELYVRTGDGCWQVRFLRERPIEIVAPTAIAMSLACDAFSTATLRA
jgi:hypothetical protein